MKLLLFVDCSKWISMIFFFHFIFHRSQSVLLADGDGIFSTLMNYSRFFHWISAILADQILMESLGFAVGCTSALPCGLETTTPLRRPSVITKKRKEITKNNKFRLENHRNQSKLLQSIWQNSSRLSSPQQPRWSSTIELTSDAGEPHPHRIHLANWKRSKFHIVHQSKRSVFGRMHLTRRPYVIVVVIVLVEKLTCDRRLVQQPSFIVCPTASFDNV